MQSRNYLQQYNHTKTLKELSRFSNSYKQINCRNAKLKRESSASNENYLSKLNHKIINKTHKLETISTSTLEPKSLKKIITSSLKKKTLKTNDTQIKSYNQSKYSSINAMKSSPKLSHYNSKKALENGKSLQEIYIRMKDVIEESEKKESEWKKQKQTYERKIRKLQGQLKKFSK